MNRRQFVGALTGGSAVLRAGYPKRRRRQFERLVLVDRDFKAGGTWDIGPSVEDGQAWVWRRNGDNSVELIAGPFDSIDAGVRWFSDFHPRPHESFVRTPAFAVTPRRKATA